jgi:hypothetical protein
LKIGAREFPVELSIDPITIDLFDAPLVWAFYKPSEIARVHHVADDDGPDELRWEKEYQRLFRAHGVYLASDLPPNRFQPRKQFMTGTRYWPISPDLKSDDSTTKDIQSFIALFRDLPQLPVATPVDEPHTAEERERARHHCDVIHAAGNVLCAVTAPVAPEFEGGIDVFISPRDFPEPAHSRKERFWTYNGKPPESGAMIIDSDGIALRTWGWIAYLYDVELWYVWEALYFRDRYNARFDNDVFNDPLSFDQRPKKGTDRGNGDGLLAYPGPLPSLRLKALRRGLQDRLLLIKLDRCGGRDEARAIATRLIPRAFNDARGAPSWPVDERLWEAARIALLDALVHRCPER